jgi:hypothetical protein
MFLPKEYLSLSLAELRKVRKQHQAIIDQATLDNENGTLPHLPEGANLWPLEVQDQHIQRLVEERKQMVATNTEMLSALDARIEAAKLASSDEHQMHAEAHTENWQRAKTEANQKGA